MGVKEVGAGWRCGGGTGGAEVGKKGDGVEGAGRRDGG